MEQSILQVVHKTAQGLHNADLMDAETLQEFDSLCLPAIKIYTPEQIKQMRIKHNLSQIVFATYLNISPSTIQKWEHGLVTPKGAALKLLNLVEQKGIEILA